MILMGLIKAAASAIGSTFKDQWKEAIRCEDMGNDILMKKLQQKQELLQIKVQLSLDHLNVQSYMIMVG